MTVAALRVKKISREPGHHPMPAAEQESAGSIGQPPRGPRRILNDIGAGHGSRTRDLRLGKPTLYQLS